ncbi:LysR family transcriptional regulator [Rhizobium leguminosarum]|uniref:LysR family transcriptional regulator n=1 Tax=Rhizobium leguminosarum TaxID=384 RepID=UPI0024A912A9|nr:LysR family transcriptional regulator [Rhizobium leguminosarum]MDI5930001.1 LysR family transcriptional regulator [Rhizobium leguminosarum]
MVKLGQLQDVDLKLLRYFCAIVEEGSFTAAQSSLNLSQSSLSEYLKALEIRLGVVLCQRGPKGFRLFEEGKEVYLAAREMFSSIEHFKNQVSNINDGAVGQLSIALQDGIIDNPRSRIHDALERFARLYPGVRIKVETMLGFQMIGKLADGLFPIGIGLVNTKFPQLKFEPLFEEIVELYCGRSHHLFDGDDGQLTPEQVGEFRYCSRGHHEWVHPEWVDSETSSGDVGWGGEAQLALILSGRNIGYLSENTAAPFVKKGLLRLLKDGSSPIVNRVAAVSGPGTSKFKLAKTFIDTLIEVHDGTDNEAERSRGRAQPISDSSIRSS